MRSLVLFWLYRPLQLRSPEQETEVLSDLHFRPVPLVSKICPSDTYKVWKSGQNLRVDTTLLGFDHMTWQRGNRSFVFRGQGQSGGRYGRWEAADSPRPP